MSQAEFYRARVREAEEQVHSATLDNVRDRNQRALDAWLKLAERAERTDRDREIRRIAAEHEG
ncbi:hypothetical protein [Rhizorhapis suberifaciens]|uniref:Uncharacterized protein n=1 Tax=Rhizorhapis suberifaciens TaxID=13656 RepID=A0A840HRB5_9SPHN|nr:hypothetical protein [Rhizorhapis suberifaciens]MBB4640150.1 hypothetical protein [Rhizorhapis suberifaciens]